jgi:hypothetical protein
MGQASRKVAAIAAVLAAFAAVATPALAANDDPDTVTAYLAPGSKTTPESGYYVFDAQPGSSTTQTIMVRDDKSHPIQANIEAVDATTTDATGVAYGKPGSQPSGTGSWILVATPEVTLQPGEARPVDFTVKVPAGTKPGVYLAGISASVPLPKTTATTSADERRATFNVTLQSVRVIAVQITVPGPREPKLVVTGARATTTPQGVALLIGLANRGNDFAKGSGTITVGDTGLEKSFKIDTFIPGTQIEYTVPWTKDVVPGDHAISVRLKYGKAKATNWDGSADISGSTKAQLEADLAATRAPDTKSDGGALPWPLIAGGLSAAILCVGGVLVLRRRRRGPQVAAATVS